MVLLVGAAALVIVAAGIRTIAWLVGPVFLALVIVIAIAPVAAALRGRGWPRPTVNPILVPLACGHCGRVIAPGALFTRHSVHVAPGVMVHMPTQVPVCTACRPVHLAPPT